MEIKNNEKNNPPLFLSKNKSTGDLMEKGNTNYRNSFIPDQRMEQYLNEYYSYLYSTKNTDKDSSNINMSSNLSNYLNSTVNTKLKPITPIENIKKHSFSLNNNNIYIPDDLLIEYNNRKRLDELRKKYLSSSSLRFLRKKDEIKINNNKEINKDLKEKNKEENLNNIIIDLRNKYDKLQKEFNNLVDNKNRNKENIDNINYKIEKDLYKNIYRNYLIEENNDLKNINNNYEIIMELLISYINETNKLLLNSEKIEYFNLKQNIINKKTKCINELSDFLEQCKENLENNINKKDFKYEKIIIKEKNNKNNLSKRENKNKSKNNMKYTYSTISFRNKSNNSINETREEIKSKTVNKTRIDKNKRPRSTINKRNNKKLK